MSKGLGQTLLGVHHQIGSKDSQTNLDPIDPSLMPPIVCLKLICRVDVVVLYNKRGGVNRDFN